MIILITPSDPSVPFGYIDRKGRYKSLTTKQYNRLLDLWNTKFLKPVVPTINSDVYCVTLFRKRVSE